VVSYLLVNVLPEYCVRNQSRHFFVVSETVFLRYYFFLEEGEGSGASMTFGSRYILMLLSTNHILQHREEIIRNFHFSISASSACVTRSLSCETTVYTHEELFRLHFRFHFHAKRSDTWIRVETEELGSRKGSVYFAWGF